MNPVRSVGQKNYKEFFCEALPGPQENIHWLLMTMNPNYKQTSNGVKYAIGIVIIIVLIGAWWFLYSPNQESGPAEIPSAAKNPVVTLKTNKGDIAIELFMDKTPVTAGNFLKLAREGFYDGTKFHRVIPNFMIQGGDPNTKGADETFYGVGGPGYTIQDEFVEGLSNVRGTIAMANTGQSNSGGSQFFINLVDNTGLDFNKPPLTSRHPVFGRVVAGMDVVNAIALVKTGSRDIPVEPVTINSVVVQE